MATKEQQVAAFDLLRKEMLKRIEENKGSDEDLHTIIGAKRAEEGTKQEEVVVKVLETVEDWPTHIALCMEGAEDFEDFIGILMTTISNREKRMEKVLKRAEMIIAVGAML